MVSGIAYLIQSNDKYKNMSAKIPSFKGEHTSSLQALSQTSEMLKDPDDIKQIDWQLS